MSESDPRPSVWVGHISLLTSCLAESNEFMVKLGMRPLGTFDNVAILELRAGTHLILEATDEFEPGTAPFDLMVEDLEETHARLSELGVSPSDITGGRIHSSFTVRDPSGQIVKFNSTHVSDQPV